METLEANKALFKFMGWEETGMDIHKPSEYEFHESFSWSMPVLGKIAGLSNDKDEFLYNYTLTPESIVIFDVVNMEEIVNNSHGESMEKMIFHAVVEFLEHYNSLETPAEKIDENKIIIRMDGGLVVEVVNPTEIEVEVRDYDKNDLDEDGIVEEDANGKYNIISY